MHSAVTLIELTISVALIAILLILALPSFEFARKSMLGTECSNNIRQVGLALLAYAYEHSNHIPPYQTTPATTDGYWHSKLTDEGYLQKKTAVRVLSCPALVSPNSGTGMATYGLRRWAAPGGKLDESQILTSIKKSSDFFLLVDSYLTTRDQQGYYSIDQNSNWRIHLRHAGKAIAFFSDGHVEAKSSDYFKQLCVTQPNYGWTGSPFFWPEEEK